MCDGEKRGDCAEIGRGGGEGWRELGGGGAAIYHYDRAVSHRQPPHPPQCHRLSMQPPAESARWSKGRSAERRLLGVRGELGSRQSATLGCPDSMGSPLPLPSLRSCEKRCHYKVPDTVLLCNDVFTVFLPACHIELSPLTPSFPTPHRWLQ